MAKVEVRQHVRGMETRLRSVREILNELLTSRVVSDHACCPRRNTCRCVDTPIVDCLRRRPILNEGEKTHDDVLVLLVNEGGCLYSMEQVK